MQTFHVRRMYIGDPLTQSLTHCCSEGRALPLWKCMQYDYAQYICVCPAVCITCRSCWATSHRPKTRRTRSETQEQRTPTSRWALLRSSCTLSPPSLNSRPGSACGSFASPSRHLRRSAQPCSAPPAHTHLTPHNTSLHIACTHPHSHPLKWHGLYCTLHTVCSVCYCITEKGWFSKYQLSTVCNLADILVRCTGLTVESWYLATYPSLMPEPAEKPPLQYCISVTELFPPPPPPLVLQEFADAMMDVKCAMSELRTCPTFKYFLACLLAVGNFLNHGKEVRQDMWTVHTYVRTYTVCTLVEHVTHRVMRGSIIRLYYIHLHSTLSSALPSPPLPSPPSFSGGGLPPQFPAKADGCEGQHQETASAASLGCHGDGKVSRQH